MNSANGFWVIQVRKPAQKKLRRAPRPERERLYGALKEMALNPFTGDIERLTHERTAFRRRVGDWRIFFDVDVKRRLVEVPYIERRTTTTYRRR